MSKRAHISLRTKLAAVLVMLHPEDREQAKKLTAEEYLSLWNWDHAVLHAIEVNDHFTNLTPLYIRPHRIKSAVDTGKVAKSRRLERQWAAFQNRMLVKAGAEPVAPAPRKRVWPKRKLASGRKFQQRGR